MNCLVLPIIQNSVGPCQTLHVPNRFLWIPHPYSTPQPNQRFLHGAWAALYLVDTTNHTSRLFSEFGSYADAEIAARAMTLGDCSKWSTRPVSKPPKPNLLPAPNALRPAISPKPNPDQDLKQIAHQVLQDPAQFKKLADEWKSAGYTIEEIFERAGVSYFVPPTTSNAGGSSPPEDGTVGGQSGPEN